MVLTVTEIWDMVLIGIAIFIADYDVCMAVHDVTRNCESLILITVCSRITLNIYLQILIF